MIMNRREHQNDQKNVPTQHRNDTGPPGFNPFKAIARRRWQLLACLLLVCGIALVATISRKMKYEAVSRVQITADSPQVGGLGMLGGGLGALGGGQLNTQRELIQSRSVLTKALQNICQNARKDECKWKTTDEGLDELRNSLRVQSVGGSQLLDIVGIAPNPVLAARIANEVTNAFIDAVTAHYAEREDGELSAPRIKATMTFLDFRYGRMTPAGHTGERIELRRSTRVDEHPGRRGTPRTVYAITAVHPSSGPDPEVEGLGEALAARVVAKLGAGAATE